jgi:DNA-binding NarL/FixJ family response regulator
MTEEEREPWRIVIADDAELVRRGVKAMLANHPHEFTVVGEASDGQGAIERVSKLLPDLAILDFRMPEPSGLEATRLIHASHPEIQILILTSHANPDYLFRAVLAGAAGYVLKETSNADFLDRIRRIMAGEPVLDPNVVRDYMLRAQTEKDTLDSPDAATDPIMGELTPKEREVIRLIALGNTNERIASRLYISTSTVKNHIESIFTKLGANDRTQAAVKAVQLGLLGP